MDFAGCKHTMDRSSIYNESVAVREDLITAKQWVEGGIYVEMDADALLHILNCNIEAPWPIAIVISDIYGLLVAFAECIVTCICKEGLVLRTGWQILQGLVSVMVLICSDRREDGCIRFS